MRRYLLLSVLFVAATLLACDEDPIAPPTTGSISLRVIVGAEPQLQVATVHTVEVVDSTRATTGVFSRTVAKIDGAGVDTASGSAPRIEPAQPRQNPAHESPPEKAAATQAAPTAIDAATIHIIGPTNRTLTNQTPGTTVTIPNLEPGAYTVVLEGLLGGASGELDHFGQTSVTVTAGNNSTATIAFNSFRPIISDPVSPSTDMRFRIDFPAVQGADSYMIESDTDAGFPDPFGGTVETAGAILTVYEATTYFVRARAVNSYAPDGGGWSEVKSVDVVTDIDPSGPDAGGAVDLGFGTAADTVFSQLNIFPVGDEDWYSVTACIGDTLVVETLAQRLDPSSWLDTEIFLIDTNGIDVIDSNDDIHADTLDSYLESELPASGTYFVNVGGYDGTSIGHYHLSVEVRPGATTCSGEVNSVTVTAPSSNLVGAGDQVQLTAEAQDGLGTPIAGVEFTWESTDYGVADVDLDGLVEAIGQGSATITATVPEGPFGSVVITVQIPASIAVSPSGATLYSAGATQQYSAQVLDEDGVAINPVQAPTITWGSLHTGVASVGSGDGIATASQAGQAIIAAGATGLEPAYGVLTVAFAGAQPVSVWDTIMPNPGPDWFWSVWGRSSSQAYATGYQGAVLQWNGLTWLDRTPGFATATDQMRDIWSADGTDYWIVGSSDGGGKILKWDGGSTWDNTIVSPTTSLLWDTWGVAPNDIHAVGSGGTLVHYDGTDWTLKTNPAGAVEMRGVWGTSSDTVYAVGSSCTVLRYDGSDWSTITTGDCTNILWKVWGTSGRDVFIVGSEGLITHFNGTGFSAMNSTVTTDLYGVWGTATNEVFAVGDVGVVLAYDGVNWEQMPSGVTSGLYDIYGNSAGDFTGAWMGGVMRGYRGLTPINIGEDTELSGAVSWTSLWLSTYPFVVPNTTEITHVSVIAQAAAGQGRLGIYADSGNAPYELLAETDPFTITGAGAYEIPLRQRVRLAPGNYRIGALFDNGIGNTNVGHEATGGTGYHGAYVTWGDLPAQFTPTYVGTDTQRLNYYVRGFVVP